jgi:tRNA(Ile)-lysidine synthase
VRRQPDGSSKKDGDSPTSSSSNRGRAFRERVAATIASRSLIARGQTVLVAISGGADSTALLHALWHLRARLRTQISACHVHHGLRGEEADADARHAAAFAASLGVPYVERRVDAASHAKERRLSLEAAARELRYARLEEAADEMRATCIATGHTADDQAETVLLNIIRGAGPAGLSGMPPMRGRVIRPLIDVTHAEVEAYCREEALAFRVDRSNLDPRFRRNRVRLEVIPLLAQLQPNVVSALCRLADVMRAENGYIDSQVDWVEREIVREEGDRVLITLDGLVAAPLSVQRRIVRRAIARLSGSEADIELERVGAVLELAATGQTGSVIELPGGWQASRSYQDIVIGPLPPAAAPPGEWPLPVPGAVEIPAVGMAIRAEYSDEVTVSDDPGLARIDAETVTPPLLVRTWRPGDRFRPLGMEEPVKLQDFFVNARVPRAERARTLLVESAGRIIWVVGYRIDEASKVTAATRRTIRLEAHPLGG